MLLAKLKTIIERISDEEVCKYIRTIKSKLISQTTPLPLTCLPNKATFILKTMIPNDDGPFKGKNKKPDIKLRLLLEVG